MNEQSKGPATVGPRNETSTLFGFLLVTGDAERGFVAGYLCLDELGAPVEFLSTSPSKPTPMQQLLYGRSLQPELIGNQMAKPLLEKADHKPSLLFTNHAGVLKGLRSDTPPVVLVCDWTGREISGGEGEKTAMLETATRQVGIRFKASCEVEVEPLLGKVRSLDLYEVFKRVQSALAELKREESSQAEEQQCPSGLDLPAG